MRPLGAKIDKPKVQEIGVNSAVGLVFVVPVRHRLLRLCWMTADWWALKRSGRQVKQSGEAQGTGKGRTHVLRRSWPAVARCEMSA